MSDTDSLFESVFSEMQVKQESPVSEILSDHSQTQRTPEVVTTDLTNLQSQDMQCHSQHFATSPTNSSIQQQQQEKSSSGYSLWAEYFDTFPVLAEFDLRAGAHAGGSTGTSIASSSSSPSENWSSPGSGSPFSECEQEDTTFIDDHAVPTSVIDEIVQTLKMDGYNFDHLGDDIIDSNPSSYAVKQEHDMNNQQPCYLQNPVYTSLNPPKLELHLNNTTTTANRKYSNVNTMHNNNANMHAVNDNNNDINCMNNNMNTMSIFDQMMDGKWCNNNSTSLPPMSISLQQIQQHTTQIQQPHDMQAQDMQNQQMHQDQPTMHQLQPQNYASSPVDELEMSSHYSTSMFPTTYAPLQQVQQYKFMATSTITLQPPPLVQTCEKSTETKPRRRRSSTNSSRVEKPHVCNECGAAFKLSANLKQHQVIHTGEKPFSCDICKAMFTRLSSLKTHHRLHTGEKPHICPFCNAAFADRSAMKAHKRIHTGERPYKCAVCSTSFTQLSHLNAHKRTHTGEKPYACLICGTTFKQLGHLKRHEKSHVCSRM